MPPVCTRLSAEETALLDAKAKEAGFERSGYVRQILLQDLGLVKKRRLAPSAS